MNLTRTDAMTTIDERLPRAAAADADGPSALESLRAGVDQWFGTCADYLEAAAIYEELARLSDAELARRGLSRETLARDVCALCERRE
jgi:hypothetical protein